MVGIVAIDTGQPPAGPPGKIPVPDHAPVNTLFVVRGFLAVALGTQFFYSFKLQYRLVRQP